MNLIRKKHVVCLLMAMLFASIAAASMANARETDETFPQTPPEEGLTTDTPNLIMTLDGNATVTESQTDEPNLYRTQDDLVIEDDNSTLVISPNDEVGGAEEENLVAAQTSPDISVLVAVCASVLVAAAAVSVVLLVRRRKAE